MGSSKKIRGVYVCVRSSNRFLVGKTYRGVREGDSFQIVVNEEDGEMVEACDDDFADITDYTKILANSIR